MILPVTVYGDSTLRKISEEVDSTYPDLPELIENMFQTMYNADGVGLAAPQVGLSIRMFVVDASSAADEEEPELKDFKRVFINPVIIETSGEPWSMEEGCLSIPNIRENVSRPEQVTLKYTDRDWVEHVETFKGFASRVIQHEYDHLEGNLFVDYLNPLRKRLLKPKLMSIALGKSTANYRTKPPR